jgi:hypothetical protein
MSHTIHRAEETAQVFNPGGQLRRGLFESICHVVCDHGDTAFVQGAQHGLDTLGFVRHFTVPIYVGGGQSTRRSDHHHVEFRETLHRIHDFTATSTHRRAAVEKKRNIASEFSRELGELPS